MDKSPEQHGGGEGAPEGPPRVNGSLRKVLEKYPELFSADRARLENLEADPWWPENLQPLAAPGEGTLLSEEWMEWFVRTYPERMERIKLETLAPEVSALHRVLAELRIVRDRLSGIECHAEFKGRLLAGWQTFRPKVLLRFLQNDLLRYHVFRALPHPGEDPSDSGQDGKLVD